MRSVKQANDEEDRAPDQDRYKSDAASPIQCNRPAITVGGESSIQLESKRRRVLGACRSG